MLDPRAREEARGALRGDTVVGTVMSNIGLERALRAEGIALARAAVGDRYVLEMMRAGGFGFGGEQSGHIIDLDRNTTGDGPGRRSRCSRSSRASGRRCTNSLRPYVVAPRSSSTCAPRNEGRRSTTPLRSARPRDRPAREIVRELGA
jgi:hypothetical protein